METITAINEQPLQKSSGIGTGTPDDDQGRLCNECASRGRTCCQDHDIFVTGGDCRRILVRTGRQALFEYRSCSNADYGDQSEDPLWQHYVFRPDGSRRVLKRKTNGDCILLTPTGCSLPLTSRPLVCRLFPHVYTARGIDGRWDQECLAAQTTAALVVERQIAGTSLPEARRWHQLLYDEITWEKLNHAYWINL